MAVKCVVGGSLLEDCRWDEGRYGESSVACGAGVDVWMRGLVCARRRVVRAVTGYSLRI